MSGAPLHRHCRAAGRNGLRLRLADGSTLFGVGIDKNIITVSLKTVDSV
jgi:hypothetical protein